MSKPTAVTPEELFKVIATIGPLYAAQYGYFHALTDIDGQPKGTTLDVEVTFPTGPVEPGYELPPTYGYGIIDLSPYNLASIPKLSGVVLDPVSGVAKYVVAFQSVTSTSATVHSYYELVEAGVDRSTLPVFSQTVRVYIN